jgi:hypothetical protein
MERKEIRGKLSLCGHPEHLVDDPVLGEDIPLGEPLDLAFAEHVHRLIALDGPVRRVKGSKPQARAFLSTVITRGVRACEAWSSWRKMRSAASASRVALSMKSSVAPVESTAR